MEAFNEKELAKALRIDEPVIELRNGLAHKTRKLLAIGFTLWCVCMSLLAVTVVSLLMMPAAPGPFAIASLVAGTPAAGIMGTSTATTAIMIALAGGGVGTLHKIRRYHLIDCDENHIILRRKPGIGRRRREDA